jgi:hypothetical protein
MAALHFLAKLGQLLCVESESMVNNGSAPRSCLGRVFNFKLGSFTDNTKIAEHENGHI